MISAGSDNNNISIDNLAGVIDHTNLNPDASEEDIKKLVNEAIEWNTAAVCVNPCYVNFCENVLDNNDIDIATVVGFPLGANETIIKAKEAEIAVKDGADELDMVMNIGQMKSGEYDYVMEDIKNVVSACGGKTLKVIIETALLSKEEIQKSCNIVKEAGADFVKTSTGFADEGATVENVRIMREAVGDSLKIKAAGGIGSYDEAVEMLKAGADRIGASSTKEIIKK